MTLNWLNRLGDRNPQLLGELRGRCQARSVAVTVGLAMVGQMLLLLFYWGQIPEVSNEYTQSMNIPSIVSIDSGLVM
jgi:hypothetical protein